MENEGGKSERIKSGRQRIEVENRQCVCVWGRGSERMGTNCPKGALIQNLI